MKVKSLLKICLVFIFTLAISVTLVGCSKKKETIIEPENTTTDASKTIVNSEEADIETDSWADIDTSEEVNIVGYLLGTAPVGMDAVMEELNAKLKEEVNATLEIRYLDWTDYTSKYPMVLAAGEDIDFIFTADWCMYAQEASKNAFYEIKEEELAKYMPRHYSNCDPIAYQQANKDGKMYMITTSTPDKRYSCLAYRKDLADKYGITELNKLSDFTAFFKAIAENETDIAPMYMASAYDALWLLLANEYSNELNISNGLCWYTEDKEIKVTPLYEEPYVSSLTYAFNMMKEWYDAGYVNKDILANEITSRESFVEGKSAIALGNSVDMQSTIAVAAEKGYDIGLIPLVDSKGYTGALSYLNNGVAIAATSENPERTMMVLDLIMEEKEYNNLVYFGIEGVNYVITEDGKIGLPDNGTEETNTYPVDESGFWFTNKEQHLPLASWTDDYMALEQQIPDMIYINPYAAFSADLPEIKNEATAITQVMQQYAQPLYVGIVDNVDEAMATLKQKLIEAGIETVREEVQRQTDDFLEGKGW